MSYTALYRKFRPNDFNDVKGQDHIVTTLRNQVKAGRVGHAFLFCGSRGTGKTTVAKVLGKVVNCENPEEGNPCNQCHMCKGIDNQTTMNVIEIDAASNNGVDSVREIVEEVRYSPTEGKYKVYIMDEVHMLSTGAFNALLKTLEEPPSYVIFILATTEVHKIPVTILSRCQRYDFKRITIDTITDRLSDLMDEEGIQVEEKALRYIARVADGSMRDALSLLDQCISFYLGESITYDNVLDVLGAVDTKIYSDLLQMIRKQDASGCIRLLDEVESHGSELGQFVTEFIWYLRNLLLVKTSDDVSDLVIEVSSENMELLKEEASKVDEVILIRYIRILSELSNEIRYASRKRVLIEVGLIKLCRPEMEKNLDSIYDRLSKLEDKIENGLVVSQAINLGTAGVPNVGGSSREAPQKEPGDNDKEKILPEAVPEDLKEVAKNWKTIVTNIGKKSPALNNILQVSTLSIEGTSLQIVVYDSLDKDFIDRESHIEIIEGTISQMIGKQVQITTRYLDKTKEELSNVTDLEKLINVPIEYE